MGNRKAIVTLAIGEKYEREWRQVCQANWQKYADKHGYDIICITKSLDNSARGRGRSPAWQKCLILSQDFATRYERIVWLDADIVINHRLAPCVADSTPLEKVGAVDAWWMPTPEMLRVIVDRLYELWDPARPESEREYTARDYYRNCGLPALFDCVVRSGVMALSPAHHREVFEKTYYEHDETPGNTTYEMCFLSYELLKADCVHWLENRFDPVWLLIKLQHYPFLLNQNLYFDLKGSGNLSRVKRKLFAPLDAYLHRTIIKQCASTAFANNYFLHFQKDAAEMLLIDDA
ncbi:MAG: hypothetical protein MSG64_05240 [Pyrinomonadaceae bacterium MAG19_C2-C3]|nr:hypothetical protein [Pyrinomonadaceae bacterium MAG19_C2-C3]